VVTKGANFSKKKSFECFSQMLFDKWRWNNVKNTLFNVVYLCR
jgi:hypothetical protein